MTRLPALCSVAGVGALALACAGAADGGEPSGREWAPLFGAGAKAEDAAVVWVRFKKPEPYHSVYCSGTLLAPNVLATALHCLALSDGGSGVHCGTDGSVLAEDPGGAWIGAPMDPSGIEVFLQRGDDTAAAFGLEVISTGSPSVCADDIAFVVLDRDVPSPFLPVRMERDEYLGELLTLVGHDELDETDARARRLRTPVLAVGPDDSSAGTPAFTVRAFAVGQGPCDDDTGSPALSEETGAVVGIFTLALVPNECDSDAARNLYTKVAPYSALIEKAFAKAGGRPSVESRPAATAHHDAACSFAMGSPSAAVSFQITLFLAWLGALRRSLKSKGENET